MSQFDAEERALFERFPDDYRAFLALSNGGTVREPTKAGFKITMTRVFQGVTYHENENVVREFWSFITRSQDPPEHLPSVLHQHFDRHVEEEFLPSNVYVIGLCEQNSLIALSLDESDYGAIYYWEWYWRYPWYEEFFYRRLMEAMSSFEDAEAVIENPNHPRHQDVIDAANYSTLVRVSDSFTEFLEMLHPIEVEE